MKWKELTDKLPEEDYGAIVKFDRLSELLRRRFKMKFRPISGGRCVMGEMNRHNVKRTFFFHIHDDCCINGDTGEKVVGAREIFEFIRAHYLLPPPKDLQKVREIRHIRPAGFHKMFKRTTTGS